MTTCPHHPHCPLADRKRTVIIVAMVAAVVVVVVAIAAVAVVVGLPAVEELHLSKG